MFFAFDDIWDDDVDGAKMAMMMTKMAMMVAMMMIHLLLAKGIVCTVR